MKSQRLPLDEKITLENVLKREEELKRRRQMKARPILFNGKMVRAIMDGRKTQTRRVVKPQPPNWITEWGYTFFTPVGSISAGGNHPEDGWGENFYKSPYGKPGDHLWVRETWQHESRDPCEGAPNCGLLSHIWYRADHPDGVGPDKWRPSIFMPRWASRLTLRVTDVRVERVGDISEEDARAEGVAAWHETVDGTVYRPEFRALWDSINAKRGYGWDVNPWVWVVTFERVDP